MSVIVSIENVVKSYDLGNTSVKALDNLSLKIDEGEFVSIAGPSGSGKTTLLNLIGCVDTATSGDVIVSGKNTKKLSDKELTNLRLNIIGFIFQSFNLVSVLNVYQNIEFPLLLQKKLSKKDREHRVLSLIDSVGLGQYAKHRPNELSGGQRQRVAIARALVSDPKIILADEPTANLDSVTGESIIDLMKQINKEHKTTFIFSTHDIKVMSHAESIIQISDGKITGRMEPKSAINHFIQQVSQTISNTEIRQH